MSDFLISVIMPAYNAEKYIAQSIDSVLSQTYTNWELLIVNDGSSDNTQSIIDTYCDKDSRIKSFYQSNGKQGKARNLAISHSKGEYLAFLDADDLWVPEKLEIQLQEINENKADLIFSKAYKISSDNVIHDEIICGYTGFLNGEEGITKMIELNRVPILTVLVKTKSVLEVGSFSEDLSIANAEDYHLWLKLIMNYFIFWGSDKILAKYRILDNSSTGTDKLSSNKLPYVFTDLSKRSVKYKFQLSRRLKDLFKLKYKFEVKNKTHFLDVLKLNCRLLDKSHLYVIFYFMTKITSLNRSKYLVKKYLNG